MFFGDGGMMDAFVIKYANVHVHVYTHNVIIHGLTHVLCFRLYLP